MNGVLSKLLFIYLAMSVNISLALPIFEDDFEYVVGRNGDPDVSATFINHGWSYVKAINNIYHSGYQGYLYTVDRIPGYSGVFPGRDSTRVLAIESKASIAQTDFYLQYGAENGSEENLPGDVWFQFWIYPNHYDDPNDIEDQLSQYASRDKFIYPCRTYYPCTEGNMNWLFTLGHTTAEPFWGNAVGDTTQLFLTTVDPFDTMIDYQLAADWNRFKIGQTDLSENIVPNRWTLVKLHFDTSTSSGTYEAWLKPQGGNWVKVAEWIDGVTPDFSWIIPAGQVGGHAIMRIPTTMSYYDSWTYLDDFVIAASESDLPVYDGGSGPGNPPAPVLSFLSPDGVLDSSLTSVDLSLNTNEPASCAYSTTSGALFANMTLMLGSGTLTHSASVGVTAGNSYMYFVKCQDAAANESAEGAISFSVASPSTANPPVLSNGRPNWTVPYTTTEVDMTVETDIAANCRYTSSSGTAFEQMQSFTRTDEVFHSVTLPVTAGNIYNYYARCSSLSSGAISDEYLIHFDVEVSLDSAPPNLSNLQPAGSLAYTVTSVALQLDTDEAASCGYATSADLAFASMTSMAGAGGQTHSANVSVSAGNSYQYFVKCQDVYGNESVESVIGFSVDGVPPLLTNGRPNWTVPYTVTEVDMTVETDIATNCRYTLVSGTAFEQMQRFTRTDEVFHSVALPVTAGSSYDYYVTCSSLSSGVLSDEYLIHFDVEAAIP